jgi:hypothetical protein
VRRARLSEIGQDAEADPPDGERGETPERLGGEGDAVIGANTSGEAILAKQALEDRAGLDQFGAGERLAGQEHATVAVGDREREAVLPVAQLELALVVGRPHRIRGLHGRERWSGGSGAAHAAAGGDQPQVLEAAGDGGAHGPGCLRPALAHEAEQLPGAPVRMAVVSLEQALEQQRVEGSGRAMRATRLIGEACSPEGVIARQELVAGLPADAVSGTELGDGHHPAQSVIDELLTELHGDDLLPRHRILLEEPETWR